MEIADLQGFAAVVRTGSFSRAAAATFRTQPAVSLQVARLERELGVRLLDRAGRRVRPTREGAAVAALAEEILDRVRRIREKPDTTGALVVGAGQPVARALLPGALRAFGRRLPRVAVTVATAPSRDLLDGVAAGRVDLAVLSMPLSADGVEVRPLRRYSFVAVGGDVRGPLILPVAGSATRAHIEGSLVAAGIAPRVAMEFDSSDLAVAMARAGLGTAIVPSFAVPRVTGRVGKASSSAALRSTADIGKVSEDKSEGKPSLVTRGQRIDRWVPPQTLCLAWRARTTDLARDAFADMLRASVR